MKVGFVPLLLGVTPVGCKQWKDWGNGQDVGEQVSMQNFEGNVPRTGCVFKATGLYFFLVTKATRGVSEGEGGWSGCDRECLLETSASWKVLVQGSRLQASK